MSGKVGAAYPLPRPPSTACRFPSIVKALTLGAETLAVDGVLLIGEHGDYAWNEKQQQLFPSKFWFYREICGLMLRYRTTSVYGPRLGELSDWT